MANSYAEDGILTSAYILYLKFTSIFIEKIPSHPQYKELTAAEKGVIKRYLDLSLSRAERIKEKLRSQFDDEHHQWLEEQKERERRVLDRQRDEEEQRQKRLSLNQQKERFEADKRAVLDSEKRRCEELERTLQDHTANTRSDLSSLLPEPPTDRPVLSSKTGNSHDSTPSVSQLYSNNSVGQNVPHFDRSIKPSYNSGVPLLSVRSELRTIVVPDILMPRFLDGAQPNTDKNIETCALLCGKPQGQVLRITHLLFPRQHGGADWCVTEDEHEILAPMERLSLITLGWIHTHPTQTAFLSSMDLHTHYSHQMCMAESIAIVCAPKYNETGFFHLTPEHGLEFIGSCDKTGFHPHPEHPPLFADAQHVTLDSSGSIDIIDMRQ